MPVMIGLPIVSSCSVESCGFNHDGCRAHAISVVSGAHAHCGTFVETDHKGGRADVAAVGACTRGDCAHNDHLTCTADAITVGEVNHEADCLTFAAR